jgi:ferric-dicitrate binding protein FerR (iron transport regulator)
LVLPDGSKVFLNAGSKLSYNKKFGELNRTVTLSGEAYFDVAKNPDKPFFIHTRNMVIRVVGTAFNVKCYPGDAQTETSLVHGRIEVQLNDRAEKIVLKPNEKLVINETLRSNSSKPKPVEINPALLSISHLTPVEADHDTWLETAWLDNKLVFRAERFEQIAKKMERWYAVSIHFNDDAIKQQQFTGVFKDESLLQALNAMQLVSPFTFQLNKNKVTISSGQSN